MRPPRPRPIHHACVRAPIGLLAELTHRCPLQCPYCSNPLELEKANTELTTAEWQKVMREAAQLGILQVHLSGGEPTARRDLEEIVTTAAESRPLHQPHHRRRAAEARPAGEAEGMRPRPRADLHSGCRHGGRERRPHRRLQGRQRQEEGSGRLGARARHAAHHQRADPSPQHPKRRGDHQLRGRAGRRTRRDRARAVLRLGAEEPRRADADARSVHGRGAHRRARARAAEGHHRHRLGGARLLREVPQALHGRLGQGHHQRHAVGPRAALPRGGIDHAPRVRQRPRKDAGRHLAQRLGVPEVSRHRVDEGAVPHLPAARDRLRRLPLPGVCPDRRRGQHRPRLLAFSAARGVGESGRC